MRILRACLFSLLLWPLLAAAGPESNVTGLDDAVQDLKKQVLDVERDLFVLEEELLFPSNTQVAVFVSMDVGEFFDLDAVKLKIDDKEVADYLYTEREVDALMRGGVQRLYLGNLRSGDHELTAIFIGKGPRGREYKRGATARVSKGMEPQYVELRITDQTADYQPDFVVREW
jgi:hypothetical protein